MVTASLMQLQAKMQRIGLHRMCDQIKTMTVEHIQLRQEYYEDFLENNELTTEHLETFKLLK